MAGLTKTGYSALCGGSPGMPNVGPWGDTLTDVTTTAKADIGVQRQEGCNLYEYHQIGTGGAAAGNFMVTSTGYTDVNGLIAPTALTAGGVAATGYVAIGRAICTVPTGGSTNVSYAWIFKAGIATGQMQTQSVGLAMGAWACPSTSTADLLEATGVAVSPVTGVARALAAVGTSSAGLFAWSFKQTP